MLNRTQNFTPMEMPLGRFCVFLLQSVVGRKEFVTSHSAGLQRSGDDGHMAVPNARRPATARDGPSHPQTAVAARSFRPAVVSRDRRYVSQRRPAPAKSTVDPSAKEPRVHVLEPALEPEVPFVRQHYW